MPKTFAEALSLKDKARKSLSLNTHTDWAVYADYGDVLPRLQDALTRGDKAPKLMVFGGYGSGKTHTLRHTAFALLPKSATPLTPIHVELTQLTSRTTFLDIYRLIFAKIEEQLLEDLRVGPDWTRLDWARFELPKVFHDAMRELQTALKLRIGPDPLRVTQLRGWFTGQGLTLSATHKLGLSNRLLDHSSPPVLVALLRAISQYARDNNRPGYMLFVEEGNALYDIGESLRAINAISEGFRALADPSNVDLGVMFAIWTVPGRPPLLRNDVMQRLQGATIELPPMRTVAQATRFIKALNEATAERPWFDDAALAEFARGALQEGSARETPGQLTPRDMLRLLQSFGERVAQAELPTPLTAAAVRPMFSSPGRGA